MHLSNCSPNTAGEPPPLVATAHCLQGSLLRANAFHTKEETWHMEEIPYPGHHWQLGSKAARAPHQTQPHSTRPLPGSGNPVPSLPPWVFSEALAQPCSLGTTTLSCSQSPRPSPWAIGSFLFSWPRSARWELHSEPGGFRPDPDSSATSHVLCHHSGHRSTKYPQTFTAPTEMQPNNPLLMSYLKNNYSNVHIYWHNSLILQHNNLQIV